MTRHFPPPDRQAITPASILIDAARCWRQARGFWLEVCAEGNCADVLAAVDVSKADYPMGFPSYERRRTLSDSWSVQAAIADRRAPLLFCA